MKIISSCVSAFTLFHSIRASASKFLKSSIQNFPNWISKWSSRIKYCDLNPFINTCVMSSRKNDQDSLKSNQFKNFSEKNFKNHSTIHIQFNHQQQFLKSFIFVLVTSFGLALLGGQCISLTSLASRLTRLLAIGALIARFIKIQNNQNWRKKLAKNLKIKAIKKIKN